MKKIRVLNIATIFIIVKKLKKDKLTEPIFGLLHDLLEFDLQELDLPEYLSGLQMQIPCLW